MKIPAQVDLTPESFLCSLSEAPNIKYLEWLYSSKEPATKMYCNPLSAKIETNSVTTFCIAWEVLKFSQLHTLKQFT